MRDIRRFSWAVALAVTAVAVGYLMVNALQAGSSYYLTVAEAASRAATGSGAGQAVRIQGVVDGSTLTWDVARMRLSFDLVDEQFPGQRLRVGYTGARPDGMEAGRTVIVEGRLQPNGDLEASAILVRCPSRYEAEVSKLPRLGR